MAPTELERLATLEAKAKTSDDLLKEVRRELKRLPGRIGRRTAHQLAECRAIQDGKRLTTGKPEPDTDYGWLKKLLVVGMTIGTLIGGAVYQVAQEAGRKQPPAISQGGNP